MCLIVIALRQHPEFPVIIAANRDEFLDRPTLPAHFWPDAPTILAGQDLRAGGTWLGVNLVGRFAALTNFRDLRRPMKKGPSRGLLVRSVLDQDPKMDSTVQYEGFNLIYGRLEELRYHNNIDGRDMQLPDGIHGLSNHLLDTPWPKVERAKATFNQILNGNAEGLVNGLFDMLSDQVIATDDQLPDTGVPLEWERKLSAIHIQADNYATRCSTVIMLDHLGKLYFEERTHTSGSKVKEEFQIELGK